MNNNNTCFICNGTGILPENYRVKNKKDITIMKTKIIKELKDKSYSVRRICEMMNIKSTSTIMYYLNK